MSNGGAAAPGTTSDVSTAPRQPRWLRIALGCGVLAIGGVGGVLSVYGVLASPWHVAFVIGTAGAALAYVVLPWRWAKLKLAAAAIAACTSGFATWVLTGAMVQVLGWKALALGAAGLPFWVAAAFVPSRATAVAAVVAGAAFVDLCALVAGPVVTFRFVYSYDSAALEAQRERLRAERGVEILVDAVATGRTDPRSITVRGDTIVTSFSNSAGIGQGACTLVWPENRCLHAGLESLAMDDEHARACAVGTRDHGHPEGHLFCARLDGSETEGVDLPDHLGLAGAFDPHRRRFYVVYESGNLTAVGGAPLAIAAHRSIGLYHPDAAVPVWSADRLVARSTDGFVSTVDLEDLSFDRVFLGPLSVGMGVGASEARREVYVADMMRPVIHVLDPVTLEERRRLRVAPGIRPIADLGETGWIACGGFYDGYLNVADATSGAVVSKTFVGKLVRALAYDEAHHAVLVGSSAGLLRVALP